MTPNPFFEGELSALKDRGYGRRSLARFWRAVRDRAAGNAVARPGLVRELRAIRWIGMLVVLVVSGTLIAGGMSPWPALTLPVLWWLLLTAWVGVELGLIRHPITGVDSPAIGLANVLSLYRGWAAAPVALIGLTSGGPTLAWVTLCLVGGITDLVDGAVALRLQQESRLGRLLDPVVDAFFFSAAAWSLAHWGLLPWWIAALITARYFIPPIGGVLLMLAMGRTMPVRHTPWGQASTLVIGLALLVHWIGTLTSMPTWLAPAFDVLALLTMALALGGILRRTPGARGARP